MDNKVMESIEDELFPEELETIDGVKCVNGKLSANDFKLIQEALGFKNKEMGDELGMSRRLVEAMRAGDRDVAPWTQKLLEYITIDRGLAF